MIIDILRHTPVWVFAILAALIALGVQRLKARDLTVRQLLILPSVMSLLSLFGLYQAFGIRWIALATWIVVAAAAVVVGRLWSRQIGVQYSPASRRIHVPGSWVPLALMMTIFFLRYVAAVSLALHPDLRFDAAFVVAIAAAYGLSSGIFAARAVRTWRSAFGPASRHASTVATA